MVLDPESKYISSFHTSVFSKRVSFVTLMINSNATETLIGYFLQFSVSYQAIEEPEDLLIASLRDELIN